MKKTILSIAFILSVIRVFACDCDIPKPALEFYASEYVFEANVISKIYDPDSLSYTVTFAVLKHYKKGDRPKTLKFTLKAEAKYTGEYNSCDWSVNNGEKWLVYAQYWKGALTFWFHCSNSKPLEGRKIHQREQQVLDNGNAFNINHYIYSEHDVGFNDTRPISNIDSIFRSGAIKDYKKTIVWLDVYIDQNGDLTSVSLPYGRKIKTDIFGLVKEYGTERKTPATEFEKDAIDLVKKVKKWEVKRHEKTNVTVKYKSNILVEFDKKEKKWTYSL